MKTGETITYPSSITWRHVSKMTLEAALEWLMRVAPDACISGEQNIGVAAVQNGQRGWLNKLAVVVEVTPSTVVALYRHDNSYWRLEKEQ